MKPKMMETIRLWPIEKYYLGIFVEGLRNAQVTSVALFGVVAPVQIELLCSATRKLYPFVSLPDEKQGKKERRRRKGERAERNKFRALSPLLITRQQTRFRPT
jgi:hypothetical protein